MILRFAICSSLGLLSASFWYDFMCLVIFPQPEKKLEPNMHPPPHRTYAKFKMCEKQLKNHALLTFCKLSGVGGACQAAVFFSVVELFVLYTYLLDSASQVGRTFRQMPKRKKCALRSGIPCSRWVPPSGPDRISDFRSGSILLTIRSQIVWVRLLYHFRYILTKKDENN